MSEAPSRNLFDGRYKETAIVLEQDDELADAVSEDRRTLAIRASVAEVLRVGRGEWDARPAGDRTRDGYGFLVLEGLLVRRVGMEQRVAGELLGPGDVLRPLEHDGEE